MSSHNVPSVATPISASTPSKLNCKSSNSKKAAPLDDRTRLKRNAGEKKRRDKLNNYISELSAMVPSCKMPQSQRKLDKSTILKLTVSYMKLNADLLPESVDDKNLSWKPSFLSNDELGQLMLEALDGFLFVIWSTGQTIYISESITPLLGHLQQDLVGKNFLELIHPDDIAHVKEKMFPSDDTAEPGYIEEQTASPTSSNASSPAPSPSSSTSETPTHLRRHFQARMRRGGFNSKSEYEMVYCSGHLRRWNEVVRNSPVGDRCESLPQDGFCLVGVGRLQCTQTIREMTPGAPSVNTWTSHHSLDAKYLFLDQNASSIIGYTPQELLGSSAYNLYHDEDLNGLARSHIALNKTGSGMTCLYRFLTKGQQWLWIKTQGIVRYRDGTKEPHSIVCQNIVVKYAEVWQYLQQKSRQYGPDEVKMITPGPSPTTSHGSPPAEVTFDDLKVEQYSPNGQYTTYPNYSAPSTTLLKQTPYYNPPTTQPNFVEFSSTTYYSDQQPTNGGGNTFKDLFPNYKPSISTEETHGRYKMFGARAANSQPCQFQSQKTGDNLQTATKQYNFEDIKPVYIQPSFLQTIGSSPQTIGSSPHPNVMITTANIQPVASSPHHVIRSRAQHMVYAVPSNQIPNVTIGGTVQEEPVVGMPVTGTPVAGTPVAGTPVAGTPVAGTPLASIPVSNYPSSQSQHIIGGSMLKISQQQQSPPPKKGVSVYGASCSEKRSLNLNSCAQVTQKRMRSDVPQNFPPYIKPARVDVAHTPARVDVAHTPGRVDHTRVGHTPGYHHIPYSNYNTCYNGTVYNGDELKQLHNMGTSDHFVYQDTGQPAKQT